MNFINHSCDPNAGYDGVDAIIALRAHLARAKKSAWTTGPTAFPSITSSPAAAAPVVPPARCTGDDWQDLVRAGLRLPGFMRAQADRVLWG